jgi:hypothetical protein
MRKARQRFWTVLESAKQDLGRLAEWLESASQTEIVAFQTEFEAAKEDLADYSEGITFNGTTTSEDATQDICAWIVGQGRVVWEAAFSSKDDLSSYAQGYQLFESRRSTKGSWNDSGLGDKYRGSRSAAILAYRIYEDRFGDSLYDAVDDSMS